MLLIQLSILVFGVFSQNQLKPAYITYTLLCCLYLMHQKQYKSIFVTILIFILIDFDVSRSGLEEKYQVGETVVFSFTLEQGMFNESVRDRPYTVTLPNKYPASSFLSINDQVQVHIPEQVVKESSSFKSAIKLQLQGRIRKLVFSDLHGNWQEKMLYRKHILAEIWLEQIDILDERSVGNPFELTKYIANNLDKNFTEFQSWRFTRSLLLGDKDQLTDKDIWLVRFLGLSHLFVVSGLHVGFIFLLLTRIVNLIWRVSPLILIRCLANKELFRLLLIAPVLIFYGNLTHWGEPVQRAVIMALVWQISKLVQQKISSYKVLFIALFVICLLNPRAIFAPGLWLSFCLVLLLLIYFSHRKKTGWDWIKVQLMLSIAALILTLGWQSELSAFSVFVNLLVVPITAFIWFPISIFACLESMLFDSDYLMLGLDYFVCQLLNGLYFFALKTPFFAISESISLIFCLLFLFYLFIWLWYERVSKTAYLLFLPILLLCFKNALPSLLNPLSLASGNLIRIKNESNHLNLYDHQLNLLVSSQWANHMDELKMFWLAGLIQENEMNAKILVWPFSFSKITVSIMQAYAPQWLILKEYPPVQTMALLSGLNIQWFVVAKKQSIKIEFWQDNWYIKHSNCLISLNSTQEMNCHRVVQLESMLN